MHPTGLPRLLAGLALLGSIDAHTPLVVVGADDPAVPVQGSARSRDRVDAPFESHVLRGCGHFPQEEAPETDDRPDATAKVFWSPSSCLTASIQINMVAPAPEATA